MTECKAQSGVVLWCKWISETGMEMGCIIIIYDHEKLKMRSVYLKSK